MPTCSRVCLLFCLLAAGCTRPAVAQTDEAPLLIFAAASTTDVIAELKPRLEEVAGVEVSTSVAGSSVLAQQIAAGAEADLFLSANEKWADFLEKKNLVARRRDLLANRLVLVVPAGQQLDQQPKQDHPQSGASLVLPQRLALADPDAVPAGIHAKAVLEKLGLWEQARGNVIRAPDVRQVLALVERGEVDAGFVYATDAAGSRRVDVVRTFDESETGPIRYPLVLVHKDRINPAAERAFAYLQSREAGAVFRRHGFTTLSDGEQAGVPASPATTAPRGWLTAHEREILALSIWVGVWAVAVSLPFAVVLGYKLARWQSSAKWVVETAVNLPLVLPPVVTGYLLLAAFGRNGLIGSRLEAWFGLQVAFTWYGAVLAAAVVGFPLMVRAVRLAFQGVDPRLESAARSLGAGPLDTFFAVSLPLALRGVIAGATLAFARGLGEFGATIMLAGNIEGQTQTLSLGIYSLMQQPGEAAASWRLVALAVALACAALVVSEWMERRGARRGLA